MNVSNMGTHDDGLAPADPTAPAADTRALVSAIREQLRSLIETPDLARNLHIVEAVAQKARMLLISINASAPGIVGASATSALAAVPLASPNMMNSAGISPMNHEQYGAKWLRELVAAIPEAARAFQNNPAKLTEAIAYARHNGMPDIAARLEEQLVGEALTPTEPKAPALAASGTQPVSAAAE